MRFAVHLESQKMEQGQQCTDPPKDTKDREWTDAGTRILGRQTYHFAKKAYYLAGRAREREWSGTGFGAGST